MTFFRRSRIVYLIIVQLAQKYTKALLFGFLTGLLLSFGFWRVYPFIVLTWFAPIERIGIVGDFTPNSLPLTIQQHISYGLTKIAPDGSVLPGLASSWTATDSGKTFTFFLREDQQWHNGNAVVARDVNYNIKNVTFTVIDSHTIRASLNNPYSPFPSLLARPLFLPGLKGFGPYRVLSIRLNGDTVNYLKLVPIDRGEKERKPSLEYRFYRTEAAAILAYKLGDVDVIEELTAAYDLSNWRNTHVQEHTRFDRIVSLFFNLSNQLLAEKNLRHGLAYAIGKMPGEPAYSPLAKTSWAYTDKVKKYTTDLSQAKKLLAESPVGTESGVLTITTFSHYEDIAQKIADSWSELGVSSKVKVVNDVSGDYQILLSAQDVPPDPDQYPFWHSTQPQTNITGFKNLKIDKLLEDARQQLDTETREKTYADFQRRIVEEAPAIFLYYPKSFTIQRR